MNQPDPRTIITEEGDPGLDDADLAASLGATRKLKGLGLAAVETPINPGENADVARIKKKIRELKARCKTEEQFGFLLATANGEGPEHLEPHLDGMLAGLEAGTLKLQDVEQLRAAGGMNRAARRRGAKAKKKYDKLQAAAATRRQKREALQRPPPTAVDDEGGRHEP